MRELASAEQRTQLNHQAAGSSHNPAPASPSPIFPHATSRNHFNHNFRKFLHTCSRMYVMKMLSILCAFLWAADPKPLFFDGPSPPIEVQNALHRQDLQLAVHLLENQHMEDPLNIYKVRKHFVLSL